MVVWPKETRLLDLLKLGGKAPWKCGIGVPELQAERCRSTSSFRWTTRPVKTEINGCDHQGKATIRHGPLGVEPCDPKGKSTFLVTARLASQGPRCAVLVLSFLGLQKADQICGVVGYARYFPLSRFRLFPCGCFAAGTQSTVCPKPIPKSVFPSST